MSVEGRAHEEISSKSHGAIPLELRSPAKGLIERRRSIAPPARRFAKDS